MHYRWAALILTLALFGSAASAQQKSTLPDDAKESGITRRQADEILNELKAIRQLLEKQNQTVARLPSVSDVPQTGKLRLEGGYSLGSDDAPLTIVEFTDYEYSSHEHQRRQDRRNREVGRLVTGGGPAVR